MSLRKQFQWINQVANEAANRFAGWSATGEAEIKNTITFLPDANGNSFYALEKKDNAGIADVARAFAVEAVNNIAAPFFNINAAYLVTADYVCISGANNESCSGRISCVVVKSGLGVITKVGTDVSEFQRTNLSGATITIAFNIITGSSLQLEINTTGNSSFKTCTFKVEAIKKV